LTEHEGTYKTNASLQEQRKKIFLQNKKEQKAKQTTLLIYQSIAGLQVGIR
jgi:hypothetical protein